MGPMGLMGPIGLMGRFVINLSQSRVVVHNDSATPFNHVISN
jgi:hypothetical protein